MAMELKPVNQESQPVKSGTLCSVNFRPEFRIKVPISPILLDDFILNRERKIAIGRDKHKYLVEHYLKKGGKVNFDLNQGMSTFDPRPQNEGLDQILQYITLESERTGERDLKKVSSIFDIVLFLLKCFEGDQRCGFRLLERSNHENGCFSI